VGSSCISAACFFLAKLSKIRRILCETGETVASYTAETSTSRAQDTYTRYGDRTADQTNHIEHEFGAGSTSADSREAGLRSQYASSGAAPAARPRRHCAMSRNAGWASAPPTLGFHLGGAHLRSPSFPHRTAGRTTPVAGHENFAGWAAGFSTIGQPSASFRIEHRIFSAVFARKKRPFVAQSAAD
jgi:hypothetical protein